MNDQALKLLEKLSVAAHEGVMACSPAIELQSLRQGGTDPVSPGNRVKLNTFWSVLAEVNAFLQENAPKCTPP